MPPDDRKQPNGNGMESPRVFNTLEEALAAGPDPVEQAYLESLDQPDEDDEDEPA